MTTNSAVKRLCLRFPLRCGWLSRRPSTASPSPAERVFGRVDDARLGAYLQIPARMCRSLELLGVPFDWDAVEERFAVFYLFTAVADDALEAGGEEAGAAIFEELRLPPVKGECPDQLGDVIELLKQHIDCERQQIVLDRFAELNSWVLAEPRARSMREYMNVRRQVGILTADVSYLLVEPLLGPGREKARSLFDDVGSVGCLVDSVLDLTDDYNAGLLAFRPSFADRLRLAIVVMREGLGVVVKYPRMMGLFVAAMVDNFSDQRSGPATAIPETAS